jgi:hypothetical protein
LAGLTIVFRAGALAFRSTACSDPGPWHRSHPMAISVTLSRWYDFSMASIRPTWQYRHDVSAARSNPQWVGLSYPGETSHRLRAVYQVTGDSARNPSVSIR